MKKQLLEVRVNGRTHELAIEPNRLLLDALRVDLQFTGSKRGCDDSSCGACTVLVDGTPMLSCTMLAASCEGQEITTVEGITEHGALAAIQKAYGDWGGAQCGFCTPGFMMTVTHLLATNPTPSESEIREALSSNLCRCTGYSQMYGAIKAAIEAEQKGMAIVSWKNIFDPDSGSLFDIHVLGTTAHDWQSFLNYLSTNYEVAYSEDGVPRTVPPIETIFEARRNATPLLQIRMHGYTIDCHFFASDAIEMDLLPDEINSQERAESALAFVADIARVLRKEVLLTPEYGTANETELRRMALASVTPSWSLSVRADLADDQRRMTNDVL